MATREELRKAREDKKVDEALALLKQKGFIMNEGKQRKASTPMRSHDYNAKGGKVCFWGQVPCLFIEKKAWVEQMSNRGCEVQWDYVVWLLENDRIAQLKEGKVLETSYTFTKEEFKKHNK